ncbi:MAG: hypothetical protein MK209_05450 [Planctomycetes bacterium]|nr:hypothetical protein [Planctomycetota bacterium]
MIRLPSRLAVLTVFGALVVVSGVYRKLSGPGGWPAFWFGVIDGSIVLLGVWGIRRGLIKLGYFLGLTGLAFVVGWFGYECLIKKPWAEVEWRPLTELIVGVLATALLAMPRMEGVDRSI